MKHLLLMRHAKSSWKDSSLSDHQRPLNKRGKSAAPKMGSLLNDMDVIPEIILCSTAKRARSTVDYLQETCNFEGNCQYFDDLYHADYLTYFDLLINLPPDIGVAMIVSHNPTINYFINTICGEVEHMPTAAIAHIEFHIADWSDLHLDSQCKLKNIWKPRELE